MAIKRYENSAWTDLSYLKRYSGSAFQDCDSAKKYENGAWTDVWTSMEKATVTTDTITNGWLQIKNKGVNAVFEMFCDKESSTGSLAGSGYIEFRWYGPWTKPTVEFYWGGGLTYWSAASTATTRYAYRKTAGTVCGITNSSYSSTPYAFVNKAIASGTTKTDQSVEFDYGTVSQTVNQTCEYIGIQIRPTFTSTMYYSGDLLIEVSNVTIDGVQYGFPDSAVFDRQTW